MLSAPIRVISIGGVMSADPGCRWVEHLHHLYGADDGMDRIGKIAFAGRWPVMKKSPWNRIMAEDKITLVPMGPTAHNGALGYFGPEPLEDGRPRLEKTVEEVCRIILEDESAAQAVSTETPEGSPAEADRPANGGETPVWQSPSPSAHSERNGAAGRSPTAPGGGQA
jgi:hypothetical protein